MDKSYRNNVKWKKLDIKKYILVDSIYIKVQEQEKLLYCERSKDGEGGFWSMGNVLYLDLSCGK